MTVPKAIRSFTLPQIRYWVLAASLGFGGLIALVAAQFLIVNEAWRFVISEMGVAGLIAGLLAGIVEPYFRGEFARDAFLAAFRYVLPTEFRDEIEKILRFEFIAEKQLWTVKVEKVNDEMVLVTTTYERTVRNKTKLNKSLEALYQAEDYKFSIGSTKIIECTVQVDERTAHSPPQLNREHDVEARSEAIPVRPGNTGKLWGKATQFRRINDSMYETFIVPIINPEIKVFIDDNTFDHSIEFGTHGDYIKSQYENHYTLSGVYFPGQFMNVRWWPRKGHHELPGSADPDPVLPHSVLAAQPQEQHPAARRSTTGDS